MVAHGSVQLLLAKVLERLLHHLKQILAILSHDRYWHASKRVPSGELLERLILIAQDVLQILQAIDPLLRCLLGAGMLLQIRLTFDQQIDGSRV